MFLGIYIRRNNNTTEDEKKSIVSLDTTTFRILESLDPVYLHGNDVRGVHTNDWSVTSPQSHNFRNNLIAVFHFKVRS